jgi:hypothetical protein
MEELIKGEGAPFLQANDAKLACEHNDIELIER